MSQNRAINTKPPFGVATKRFAKVGFHPELDVSGSMKREITKAAPGTYNPEFPKCSSKRGMSWKRKVESEIYSKYLGFRNANILAERAFLKRLRGPGTNDLNEDYYKRQSSSVLKNTGFGTGDRFKYLERDETLLSPNVYFRKLEQTSTVNKCQFSNIQSFEWDGFMDRFKSRAPSYTLAPNRYRVNDGKDVRNIVDKTVSLRGPYDLFTGPRDGSTIKNHFSPATMVVPEYGFVKPSDVDILLKHPSKKRCGRFLKGQRVPKKPTVRSMLNDLCLCYRDPNEPGPAHYDFAHTYAIQSKEKNLYPFNTSVVNARPLEDWKISPGPGRYTPGKPKCTKYKKAFVGILIKMPEKHIPSNRLYVFLN
ncbi:hypothetical protein NQ318_011265, partial [Aromia moschata]